MEQKESIKTDQQAIDEMLKLLEGKTKFKCTGGVYKGYLYHILGIFDNEQIAVKYFGKHKRWWYYEFLDVQSLYQYYINGYVEIK